MQLVSPRTGENRAQRQIFVKGRLREDTQGKCCVKTKDRGDAATSEGYQGRQATSRRGDPHPHPNHTVEGARKASPQTHQRVCNPDDSFISDL